MTIKACVVCGTDFDAVASAKTCSATCRAENNRSRDRAYGRAYYKANREIIQRKVLTWQRANPEKVLEKSRAWKRNHPGKVLAETRRQNQKKQLARFASKLLTFEKDFLNDR